MEKENFKDYSFITVCTEPEGQEQKIIDELLKLTPKQPGRVMQLKINDLLRPERKNKVKYATSYRIIKKYYTNSPNLDYASMSPVGAFGQTPLPNLLPYFRELVLLAFEMEIEQFLKALQKQGDSYVSSNCCESQI